MTHRSLFDVPARRFFQGAACGLLLALLPLAHARAGELQARFDNNGLTALQFGEHAVLADPTVAVTRVTVTDTFRDRSTESPQELYAGEPRTFSDADLTVLASAFDPEGQRLTQTFAWGTVALTYRRDGNRLDLTVEVANTSDRVIELVELTLMELRLPGTPVMDRVSSIQRFHSDTNIGGFDVRRARYDGGQALFVSTIPNQPLRQHVEKRRTGNLALTVSAGHAEGGREVYHGIWNAMSIQPGDTDTYRLSLRFGTPEADAFDLVTDIWRAFGEAFPQTFEWPDRRPIGEMHVADSRRTPENPRAWQQGMGMPTGWNLADADSHAVFHERAMAHAARQVKIARELGLQGIIAWQIEGMEFDAAAYYGEPRVVPYSAPEMDAAIDDYFRAFTDAGLRVGVTIRHQIIFPRNAESGEIVPWEEATSLWARQHVDAIPEVCKHLYDEDEAWCPLTRLDNKIRYAKQRWGATLFYVDANTSFWRPRDATAENRGWDRRILSAELFGELQRRHPDCLIIPEHQYPLYYAYGAQYSQPPGWGRATGPDLRAAYPETATVLKVTDRRVILDNLDHYVRAVENGDMQFAMAWYGGDLAFIRTVYGKAMESAPFQIRVSMAGITLGDQPVDGPEALRESLAEALKDRPPLRDRRAFVRYADALDTTTLQAVLDAIVEAGGIIGWTQIDDT